MDRCGTTELPRIPDGPAGLRSTAQVDFHTGRALWPVQKCHLNAMVADTDKWEQSAAFALDAQPGVAKWVKNDHLGFTVPYQKGSLPHQYRPDFIAVLDTGIQLVIELKGVVGDDAHIKQAAMKRWVDAVNLDGRFGLWACEMVTHPGDLAKLVYRHARTLT